MGAALCVNIVASRAGAGAGAGAGVAGAERAASRIYVVRPGDTIWGIARRQAGPREDPRPLVDRLIHVNGLRGALIRPGQQLVLPS